MFLEMTDKEYAKIRKNLKKVGKEWNELLLKRDLDKNYYLDQKEMLHKIELILDLTEKKYELNSL
mgnify:FL=1|jgi:hypothetical protein